MPEYANIVVVMADQFRAAALGMLTEDPVRTPHLDRLAETGCVAGQAVSSYPVCSPHRAMFLTGMRPAINGVTGNVHSESALDGVGLRDGLPTWASILRDHGYRTGYVGKWHLEPPVPDDERYGEGRRDDGKVWDAWSPPERRFGFDFWYSYGAADRHLAPHYWTTDAGRDERVDVDQWSAEHETDVAIEHLQALDDDLPFALMLSLNPPHQPFDQVPERYRSAYSDMDARMLLNRPNVTHDTEVAAEATAIARDYFAAVTGVDEQVGRLADVIADRAGARPTVMLFTSDHGMQLGSHGLIYKNVAYEESMRLPLVVHAPGLVPAGRTDVIIDSLDFAPTILGLAGVRTRDPRMAGRDRSAALLGGAAADPDARDATIYLRNATRADPSSARGLRTAAEKIVATWDPASGLELEYFHLVADPFELDSRPSCREAMLLAGDLLVALDESCDAWEGRDALRAAHAAAVSGSPMRPL